MDADRTLRSYTATVTRQRLDALSLPIMQDLLEESVVDDKLMDAYLLTLEISTRYLQEALKYMGKLSQRLKTLDEKGT